MRWLYTLALSLVISLGLVDTAAAQKTKSQLNSEISTNFPDNTTGLITPAITRTTTNDMVLSWVDWLTCTGTGGIVFWNAGTPTCLNAGTNGQFLQMVAGAPAWSNITAALTGGSGISITGSANATIAFATIPTLDLLANTTGGTAVPVGTTGTAYLDAAFGSTRGQILVRGASTWGVLSLGTNGQQLVSNGTDLIYSTGTASKANVQTFTATGTWTKPGGFGATAHTHIQCWGGGGSGGAVAVGTDAAGGGGGGAYNEVWLPLSSLPATVTVTIGAGGAGVGANSAGNAGGTTTFGSFLSAFGGGGGGIQTSPGIASGGGGGGQFSTGAVGVVTVASSPGSPVLGQNSTDGFKFASGAGDDSTNSAPGGVNHGGGGGGGNTAGQVCTTGRASVFGGGGGGGASDNSFASSCAGGASQYGGTGGASQPSVAGTQPGGGSGAQIGGSSQAGAAGKCIATTYDGT